MKPVISRQKISEAQIQGLDELFNLVVGATFEAIGGQLDAASMSLLEPDQITLLAYSLFRDEVLDGGFVQLIHNGLGPFCFLNPFAKAIRLWGEDIEDGQGNEILHEFSKLIYKGRKLFEKYGAELTGEMSDEEFMALFEQYPKFDDLDDAFIEMEEDVTLMIATFVEKHLEYFVELEA